jgi:elongation factor P
VLFYQGNIIGIDLPNFVELEVIETEPEIKGDTATGANQEPLWRPVRSYRCRFREHRDKLRIDTRSGQYMERV